MYLVKIVWEVIWETHVLEYFFFKCIQRKGDIATQLERYNQTRLEIVKNMP